jgi:hypothetical protein
MPTPSFRTVVNGHLEQLSLREENLAAAAEVSQKQMVDWLEQGERHNVDREHVNRIAFAIAFLHDNAGDSGAIDRIEFILTDLLAAAGCDPFWDKAA